MKALAQNPMILLVALLLMAPRTSSADLAVSQDLQAWTQFTIQGPIYKNWRGYAEFWPKFGHAASRIDSLAARSAVGYNLSPLASLWLGYAYVPQFQPMVIQEHRFWEQFLFFKDYGPLRAITRTRLEQRHFEPDPWNNDYNAWRIRQMFRFQLPLEDSGILAAVAWDEIFFHFSTAKSRVPYGYDQNRAFFGLNYGINRNMRLEGGYMHVYPRPQPVEQVLHVLYLGLNYVF